MEEKMGYDDGTEKSEQLKQEFIDSIPEERKEVILNKTERLSQHAEAVWKSFGHNPEWLNKATINSNRSVNLPTDESLYARRDAHCTGCRSSMWLIVDDFDTKIKGGQYECDKR